MNILVYGAGAVGGYLGGRLAQVGHQVTLVVRPAAAEAIRGQGLSITEAGEQVFVLPAVVPSIDQAFPDQETRYDLILLGMKAYDVEAAADRLAAFCPTPALLVTLQNGIGVEQPLIARFGADHVIAGSVTIPLRLEKAHQIVVEREKRGVGLAAVAPGQNVEPPAALLQAAGVQTWVLPDYQAMKWSKAFLNIVGNATSAILNRPPAFVYRQAAVFDLEIAMLAEAWRVMQAMKLPLVDLPGAPARRLAWAVTHLPAPLLKPILTRIVARGRGSKMPSFQMDLAAGKTRNEVLYHNGAIARSGRRLAIPTPVNTALTDILLSLARRERPWSHYEGQPQRLVDEVGRYSRK
ncbi:MAG: ketopantoate reductase family protein [Chloroflexota bacterium]